MGLRRIIINGSNINNNSIDDFVVYIERSITYLENSIITEVRDNAFNSCSKLTTVLLPNVTKIGYGAFISCSRLSDISLPKVNVLGESSFYKCTSLIEVKLLEVINIGWRAFYYCSNLKKISLPNATNIGNDSFTGCNNLVEIHFSLKNKEIIEKLNGYSTRFGASKATIYFDL